MARIVTVAFAQSLLAAVAATGSDCQLFAAFGTARIDNGTATACFHAHAKTVGTLAADN